MSVKILSTVKWLALAGNESQKPMSSPGNHKRLLRPCFLLLMWKLTRPKVHYKVVRDIWWIWHFTCEKEMLKIMHWVVEPFTKHWISILLIMFAGMNMELLLFNTTQENLEDTYYFTFYFTEEALISCVQNSATRNELYLCCI